MSLTRKIEPEDAFCPIFTPTNSGLKKSSVSSNSGTGHFYTTTKNKRTMTEKMEIKKFDPVVRKHVTYKEAKIK